MSNSSGYILDFATQNGVVTTIDVESQNKKYWKDNLVVKNEALTFVKSDTFFNNLKILKQALERKFDYIGLIFPGGQGLMVDLKDDINYQF